ncbi:oxygenase MpaB family protein [Amycolatopsis aidingensis]|uniref:oxygenase MpaB family protein n=1 Tax=Amycolatopsis aidingensis TaxID=2842453 RepID=UPI001E341A46|nr:oxygenase MpaB family protein [Amycolatopsis aidingensis]
MSGASSKYSESRLRAPEAPGKALAPAVRGGLFGPVALVCGAAFLALYLGSGATDVWFAWTVANPLTATTVGAGFGAAFVLFVLAALEPGWINARIAGFAPLVLAGGSLLAINLYDGDLNPARTVAVAGFSASVPVAGLWVFVAGLVPLLAVLTLPAQFARRRDNDLDSSARTAPMPVWTRVIAGIEATGLCFAGAVFFARPGEFLSWWPWPVSTLDLRELSVLMVTVGLLILQATVEGDLRRVAAGLAALVAFGVLVLAGVLWHATDLHWDSPSAWVFLAVVTVLLGTGALGLLLLGLLRVVLPVLSVVTGAESDVPPSTARLRELARGARSRVPPHADHGFFGPGSVTWKVWTYPTSLTVGFQRAVVVEELDPALVASVDATGQIRTRPRTRYDRTLRYFAMVAFGGTRSTMKAADILVKVHSTAIGVEPGSGARYDANDPHSQLWIHLTAWHSILYAYEKYGPGKLSPQDEARYWADCATAAELQTCDPADVPRDREGVRAYFERMRPHLVGSQVARSTMDHLLHAEVMLPPLPPVYWPATLGITTALRIATIAAMPRWMRELAGIRQSGLLDALIVPVMRLSFRLVRLSRWLQLAALHVLSPSTTPVVAPVLLGVPPTVPDTLAPARARERYGYPNPAQAHLELRAKQHQRVFTEHQTPSDTGLAESEPILGTRE